MNEFHVLNSRERVAREGHLARRVFLEGSKRNADHLARIQFI
jgi:hypothetical protein